MNEVALEVRTREGTLIGARVPRKEDARLLRGGGRYTDDLRLPGEVHAYVRRSDVAHGYVRRVDAAAARAMPGVLAVYTAAEIPGPGAPTCSMPLASHDGTPLRTVQQPTFAAERVRYVGEPLALVVAESAAAAKDAAEAIEVEIDALSAVVDSEAALAPDAPLLHEGIPNNLSLDWQFGDAAAVDAAFAKAAHVTRLRLVNNRVVVASMEPRGAIAEYDATEGRFTLHVGCQGVFGMKGGLAALLGVEPAKVRVLSQDVGGSFGMKAAPYPEYIGILYAARELGRPVRWIDERAGAFLSDCHGRDSVFDCALALDAEGRFLAARAEGYSNLGAYVTAVGPLMQTGNIQKNMPGPYWLPMLHVRTRCVLTNTTPISAYRGAGRPEGVYFIERLIDAAARELGVDRIELRRRNLVRPDEMPYTAASGLTYDSGDFPAVLEKTIALADVDGFAERRRDSEARGRRRGLGVISYLEVTAPPSKEMGGIRFEPDGRVSIVTGTLDYGQGHASPFAQVLADRLGVPLDAVDLVQKDSDQLLAGGGTGGSRSLMASGSAILEAAEKVIEQGRALAGHVLEAAAEDVEFEGGRFVIKGTDRGIGVMELAAKVRTMTLPDELPRGLDASLVTDSPPSAFPNGCHVAEVEIDPDTGVVEVVRYAAVDDFGTVVNPMLAEGQVHGGVVQGIGQALWEQAVYSEDGQLLSGSFMDYAMPRADLVPSFEVDFHPVPAKTNPLGVKGCGEAGVSAALPVIMNAILDALTPLGVADLDMPATPERVWRAIQKAKAAT